MSHSAMLGHSFPLYELPLGHEKCMAKQSFPILTFEYKLEFMILNRYPPQQHRDGTQHMITMFV